MMSATSHCHVNESSLQTAIDKSFTKTAPFWPLRNLIACNPLAGLEEMPFFDALQQGQAYFQQDHSEAMQAVNCLSIKWLQAFFDQGQATISMPLREQGLLASCLRLLPYDNQLTCHDAQKVQWLKQLKTPAETIITQCLAELAIETDAHEAFLSLLLTTLPGWAAYVHYRCYCADVHDAKHPHSVSPADYLALRILLTRLIWPQAKALLSAHQNALAKADIKAMKSQIIHNEKHFQDALLMRLKARQPQEKPQVDGQLIFCIDVRSEPFRRALEQQGAYETFGFAGFFGVPLTVKNSITGESYASCPVLLKPESQVSIMAEQPQKSAAKHEKIQTLRKLYQSLKYTFTTPFSLVETLGLASGIWMGLRTFSPMQAAKLQAALKKDTGCNHNLIPSVDGIGFAQRVSYAAGALTMMGLRQNFAPLVVFCGHASSSENNAFASALDCGACGGHPGGINARVLSQILNQQEVRQALQDQGIIIPASTHFMSMQHNTCTDGIELHHDITSHHQQAIQKLRDDLAKASLLNNHWRSKKRGLNTSAKKAQTITALYAKDWAQVRPEWGLANNAALIIGPRWLSEGMDLDARVFLHSYDYARDDGSSLEIILTAPMIVAQWINAQYLFSTLDNVAFGSGSKVTSNITGKIGVMQGNASDLMHGLPLQSVYLNDDQPYHQILRLSVIVHAPRQRISAIVTKYPKLQSLFVHAWLHMFCIEPKTQTQWQLQSDLTWQPR